VNRLFVPVIASAMLISNFVAAEALKRSSIDRYSIKGIKIGMSVAEVKKILPELQVVSTSTAEDYFELHTKRPSKVTNEFLQSLYEGMFFHDQLTHIKTSETYDKLDCPQIRDKLYDKYGKVQFIRMPKDNLGGFPQKYTVEVKMENHTQDHYDSIKGNVISKFQVVHIQDGNQGFRFSQKITCYEIDKGVPKYGEGTVHGLLTSETLKKEILAQEARDKEAARNRRWELEMNKRKDMDADDVNL